MIVDDRSAYRAVVCISDENHSYKQPIKHFLQYREGPRVLTAGIVEARSGFPKDFGELPVGADCKMLRNDSWSTCLVSGAGAGWAPTTAAMFHDARRLGML